MILRPVASLTFMAALIWMVGYLRTRGDAGADYARSALGIHTIVVLVMWLVGIGYLLFLHFRYGTAYQYPRPRRGPKPSLHQIVVDVLSGLLSRIVFLLVVVALVWLYTCWKSRH